MHQELISQDDLSEWTGIKQRPKLERWLNQNRIAFTLSADSKIVTTKTAINLALVGDPSTELEAV